MPTSLLWINSRSSANVAWEPWSSCVPLVASQQSWSITYIIDNGGFLPNEDHCLYIRGITREDAIQFARDNGIRRPDAIIRDVVAALKQFRTIATKHGVSEQWTGRVETTIIDHLKYFFS